MVMRIAAGFLALAGLSACGIQGGQNPNYRYGSDSPYDNYRQAREVALTTGNEPPRRVPVALPVEAPTAAEIAGPRLMQTVARQYRGGAARPAPVQTTPSGAPLPVVQSGPYAGSTPVLVRYAYAADHAPGTVVWQRAGGSAATAARVCASYADADRAQMAFLAAGGPDVDPRGMDPDGDGFVCGWDPARWRVETL
ncbi:hypothetical protein MLD63_04360 [Paracoccus sp. TK19116]|uniref:Excalibur calcium-binding domain-containing protein n=1 Tax=Paracoccus albicereus TaxID=2922394 RepID=A0ABT1MS07_9RHOB|nr:hypothetical protein [Paracoccus albicereus]MCQ0969661.1 hypothetical protein [Paracoccus albicereus]